MYNMLSRTTPSVALANHDRWEDRVGVFLSLPIFLLVQTQKLNFNVGRPRLHKVAVPGQAASPFVSSSCGGHA